MAKSFNKGIVTTTDAAGKTTAVAGIKWSLTHRVKSSTPEEVQLVNVTSPLGRVEKFRLGAKPVNDIYKGKSIYAENIPANTTATKILVALDETWLETNSLDATYEKHIPITGTLTLTIPSNETITTNDLTAFLGRLISGLYDGEASEWRFTELANGVLTPSTL